MSGWFLKDPEHPERTIVGRLGDVNPGNPAGNDGNDGDSGFYIRPNDPYYYILKNRDDQWNDAVQIECEINVWPQFRTEHANWISSMASSEITASGVWVEDTGHDNKTELHPLDIIYGRVHRSMITGNWLRDLEANGYRLDVNMYLFRFAMATDVRALFSFDDQSDGRPPLAGTTRPVTFTPELPPRPPFLQGLVPSWDMRTHRTNGTILGNRTSVRVVCGEEVLDVTITPQSVSDEQFNARRVNPAAVLLGEFITFWSLQRPVAR
jgi:hypothetical protein